MKIRDKRVERKLKVRKRIRGRVHGTSMKPRLSIFRSNTSMYVQLINDAQGKTLASTSLRKLHIGQNNLVAALQLGKAIAEQATQSTTSRHLDVILKAQIGTETRHKSPLMSRSSPSFRRHILT